jgi:hypothetical protein
MNKIKIRRIEKKDKEKLKEISKGIYNDFDDFIENLEQRLEDKNCLMTGIEVNDELVGTVSRTLIDNGETLYGDNQRIQKEYRKLKLSLELSEGSSKLVTTYLNNNYKRYRFLFSEVMEGYKIAKVYDYFIINMEIEKLETEKKPKKINYKEINKFLTENKVEIILLEFKPFQVYEENMKNFEQGENYSGIKKHEFYQYNDTISISSEYIASMYSLYVYGLNGFHETMNFHINRAIEKGYKYFTFCFEENNELKLFYNQKFRKNLESDYYSNNKLYLHEIDTLDKHIKNYKNKFFSKLYFLRIYKF